MQRQQIVIYDKCILSSVSFLHKWSNYVHDGGRRQGKLKESKGLENVRRNSKGNGQEKTTKKMTKESDPFNGDNKNITNTSKQSPSLTLLIKSSKHFSYICIYIS